MTTSTRDFVTVDMRGLKPALVARARAQRVSVSVVVRAAVARDLGLSDPSVQPDPAEPDATSSRSVVKLSLRLTPAEADHLRAGAWRAGLSRGAFLAGLLAEVPCLQQGGSASRVDCLAALTASTAELSTVSRGLRQLAALLGRGDVARAQQYRRVLDTVGDDVRTHLGLAASILADLRPAASVASARRVRRAASRKKES